MKPWELCAEWFRSLGYVIERAEYRKGPRACDAWGVGDLVAIRPTGARRRVYVQACHYTDVDDRILKALNAPALPILLRAGHAFVAMGWHTVKRKGEGRRKVGRARQIVLHEFDRTGKDPFCYQAKLEVLSGGPVQRPDPGRRLPARRPVVYEINQLEKNPAGGIYVARCSVVDTSVEK